MDCFPIYTDLVMRAGVEAFFSHPDGLPVIFQDVVPLQIPRKPVVAGAVRK
jgi:hypothetical protein